MPRPYSMANRVQAVEETRRRIVEATVRLHAEKGVLDTSIADIAARADVAIGTVYRHFQTIEDLVVACGRAVLDLASPPKPELLARLDSLEDRVLCLFESYCDVYSRLQAAGMDHSALRYEASKMRPLADWFEAWDRQHEALVREALGARSEHLQAVSVLVMLSAWDSWRSLTSRGLSSEATARLLADIALRWLDKETEVMS